MTAPNAPSERALVSVHNEGRGDLWFVGDVETAGWCDFIPAGSDDACDGPSDYEVRWQPAPHLGDDPVSTVCLGHVLLVDRAEVRCVRTHPLATPRRSA